MGKSELEKMHTCELYLPGDEDIAREQIKCLDRLYDFNMTRPTEMVKRQQMLKEMFEELLYRATTPCKLGRQICSLGQQYICEFQPYNGG